MKTQQIKISVPGIVSVQTAMLIEKEAKKIKSVKPYVSVAERTAQFWYNPKRVSKDVIIQKVKDLGFDFVSVESEAVSVEESPLFSRVVNGNVFEVSDVVCRREVSAKRFVYLCAAALRGSGCAAESVTKALCEKHDIDYAKPQAMKFAAGQGAASVVDGESIVCGSAEFMKAHKIEVLKTDEHRIYAANSGGIVGWVLLKHTYD